MTNISVFFKKTIATMLAAIATLTVLPVSDSNETEVSAATTYSVVFPLNKSDFKLSSKYGWRTLSGKKSFHYGIDITPNSTDKTVYSAVEGEVVATANNCWHHNYGKACKHSKTYGNYVKIKSTSGATKGKYFYYGHVQQDSILVKNGQKVKAGQALATVGSSGYSTGIHLHFEVRNSSDKQNSALNTNPDGGVFKYTKGPYIDNTVKLENGKTYTIKPDCAKSLYVGTSSSKGLKNSTNICLTNSVNNAKFIAHKSGSYWYFTPVNNSKLTLDCAGNTTHSGSNLQLYKVLKNSTQLFKVVKSGNSYQLIPKSNSNVAIDVKGEKNFKNGTNIQLYKKTDYKNPTQNFTFSKVK